MLQLLDNLKRVAPYYALWVITIGLVITWSIANLTFTPSFPYYHDLSAHYNRFFASFAHFDGIHYLRLIKNGYDDTGSQAFFPLYPLLIRSLTFNIFDPLYVAMFINALFTFIAISVATLHLKSKSAIRYVLLFLSFPTSFFLLTNYTESVFILLVVLFFYFLTEKKYIIAAVIAGLASATRFVGIFLALSLAYELYRDHKSLKYSCLLITVSLSGLISFVIYLLYRFGDPLMFIHVQTMFNNGRSGGEIVTLPQVLFRYGRILLTTSPSSFVYIRALGEVVVFTFSMIALYKFRHVMRVSSLLFCLFALLLPTISGTFSSYPRYLLVAVPLFQVIAEEVPPRLQKRTILVQYVILIVVVALFVQGIFIA